MYIKELSFNYNLLLLSALNIGNIETSIIIIIVVVVVVVVSIIVTIICK